MKKILSIFLIVHQILYTRAGDACENCFDDSVNYNKLLSSNSIIYELTKTVNDIDIESNKCKEELLLIGDGIRKNKVWAFKSKYKWY